MVVSFMIVAPLPWRRPLVGGLTPTTNSTAPIRRPLPDFFEELSRTLVVRDPDSTTGSRRLRSTSSSAPNADKLFDQTDRFGALARLNPSPVVELNRAVAVGWASGPEAVLALLEPLLGESVLERYQPLHAAHAELLSRATFTHRRGGRGASTSRRKSPLGLAPRGSRRWVV
jgi:hypothetical protein